MAEEVVYCVLWLRGNAHELREPSSLSGVPSISHSSGDIDQSLRRSIRAVIQQSIREPITVQSGSQLDRHSEACSAWNRHLADLTHPGYPW